MEEIRGKTLKEWKDYCKSDNVPIKTMKYITCLEERIEALTIPVVSKAFYCLEGGIKGSEHVCKKQCDSCNRFQQ